MRDLVASKSKNKNTFIYPTLDIEMQKKKNILNNACFLLSHYSGSDVRMEVPKPRADPCSELLEKLGGTKQVKPLFL